MINILRSRLVSRQEPERETAGNVLGKDFDRQKNQAVEIIQVYTLVPEINPTEHEHVNFAVLGAQELPTELPTRLPWPRQGLFLTLVPRIAGNLFI